MTRRILPVLLITAMFVPAFGAEVRDLADLLARHRQAHDLPGLAAMVLRDGRITAAGAVGVRKASHDAPLTIHDRFHIGSCTKAMTATLCAVLVDQKLLDWNASVGAVLGKQFAVHPEWNPITMAQLLNHRGGAPAELPLAVFATRGQNTQTARRRTVELLLSEPPGPTDQFVYSNAGYVIVGAMLESLTGKSWEDLIRQHLFDPLEMTSAGFGAPGLPGTLDQPRGHRSDGTPLEPTPFADNPLAIGPAGTVHLTLGDWLKFAGLHLRGMRAPDHPQENHTLLGISLDSFARLTTPPNRDSSPAYTHGWIVARSPLTGDSALTHDGSNTLWYATIWLWPRLNLAIVVAANQGGDSAAAACHAALQGILQQELAPRTPAAGER
ncbi:MAG: beta-lactamase family protein [Phycisphaerae bacterium]|nr:beta-lactamase family protein [Phycisphaerae bacterium]